MQRNCRAGMSLIEMLVAMVVTLIMMGGVVALFGTVGDSVSGSRAVIEISERLRYARNRLQEDLSGVTVTMQPPRKPEAGEGYFEYIEGPQNDMAGMIDGSGNPLATTVEGYGLLGDTDDLVMFTARSRGEPFVGRINGQAMSSPEAEIAWFALPDMNAKQILTESGAAIPLMTLYRRVRLVAPQIILNDPTEQHDLSVNLGTSKPNTLGDLTKRENRSGIRDINNFPYELTGNPVLAADRVGEDVILTNVLAFDVRAWDPNAPVLLVNNTAITPGDKAYGDTSVTANPLNNGCYVDLGFNSYLPAARQADPLISRFAGLPDGRSGLTTPTYCTWSWHYEADGPGVDGIDDSTNGVVGIVDDPGEMVTSPPYPVPLRGIQVKIRVYEPDSRQVREVTLVQDFLPQ